MKKVIFEFEDDDLGSEFVAWMSDGGGEQEFNRDEDIANFIYRGDTVRVERPEREDY